MGLTRGLGAFSGGLDGMLAALVLTEQDVLVELVTFESPFFSCSPGRAGAEQLDLPWRCVDFTDDIMKLLRKAPSGFGRNMNPCIDCHAAMFERLGSIMEDEGFDFVFSGEVLGQRPFSQNRGSLRRVARLSGLKGLLLRPLSARLLEPTRVEQEGLVDRSRLLDISGRSRARQIELAARFGLTEYQTPAGGCMLTEPGYSARLRVLIEEGLMSPSAASMIRHGRMFRLGEGSIGLVGRDEADNLALEGFEGQATLVWLSDRPGPTGLLMGEEKGLETLASIVLHYAGTDPGESADLLLSSGEELRALQPLDRETARSMMVLPEGT